MGDLILTINGGSSSIKFAVVFAAGIGENVPLVRARICDGLEFLGIQLDEQRNKANAAVMSTDASRVTVRVIRTDEEAMMAEAVRRVLQTC